MEQINEIKEKFKQLPASLQVKLLDELLQAHEMSGQIIEQVQTELSASKNRKPCPHCSSTSVYKRGKQSGTQMYQCRECKKWYSETTGTPLWDIKHKDKWQAYLRCMQQGMSIKKSANEVGICIQTAFDWRHKILSSLDSYTPESLTGTVETDEMELPVSNKGSRNLNRKPRKRASDFKRNQASSKSTVVQVVASVERGGEKIVKAVETKRLSADHIAKVFDQRIEPGTTLITDNHPSYKLFTKRNPDIKHRVLYAKEHVSKDDASVHLQRANNTHSQIRTFLRPFNGVSSKYLQNYLNWYAYADKLNQNKETLKHWLVKLLISNQAYELFWLFKENAVIIRT
jgi:transposase-like protein